MDKKFIPVFAISMIMIFGTTQTAFAGLECVASPGHEIISASPNSNLLGTPQQADWCDTPIEATYYFPDSLGSQQAVQYNPNAGPWEKTLLEPSPAPPSGQGFFDTVIENLVVAQNSPEWTDWHEEIISPQDWFWGNVFVVVNGQVYINTDSNTGLQFLNNGNYIPGSETAIWIDFVPPLPPGTTVYIEKELNFPNFNQGPVTFPVIIEEYPTVDISVSGVGIPIDTTALLLASAQSLSLWMIPIIAAGIGIGAFVIKRKN